MFSFSTSHYSIFYFLVLLDFSQTFSTFLVIIHHLPKKDLENFEIEVKSQDAKKHVAHIITHAEPRE
jgi:hypothetical protein